MERIFFEVTSGNVEDFRELAGAGLRRRPALGAATALALKQKQVARLESKIAFLERKQEDLNRKVDEYVQGVRALILSLEQSMKSLEGGAPGERRLFGGTRVRCLGCEAERVFRDLSVLGARDTLGSPPRPEELPEVAIEFMVEQGGAIKKGRFRCLTCGSRRFSIREL